MTKQNKAAQAKAQVFSIMQLFFTFIFKFELIHILVGYGEHGPFSHCYVGALQFLHKEDASL